MIGNNGITPAITEEIDRALTDHELIKVKLPAGSKHDRDIVSTELATTAKANVIHTIGRMALLLRKTPMPTLSYQTWYATRSSMDLQASAAM